MGTVKLRMSYWIGRLTVSTSLRLLLLLMIFSAHDQVVFGQSEELQEFLGSFLIDNSLGESFIDHLIAAKYVFKSGPYANTLDFGSERKKRSLSQVIDKYNSGLRNLFSPQKQKHGNNKKPFSRGIYPRPPSNKTTTGEEASFWKPVKNHQPFYNEVKPQFKAGNQTYKLVYNNKLPPKKENVKRKDVYPVYKGYPEAKHKNSTTVKLRPPNTKSGNSSFVEEVLEKISKIKQSFPFGITSSSKEDEKNTKNAIDRNHKVKYYPKNAVVDGYTSYPIKKLPKFIAPFPFGIYTKDPIRPFPTSSSFLLVPGVIIPFIPMGTWDVKLPIGWDMNYLVERFNGYSDDSLTMGRGKRSRFAIDQRDLYEWAGNILSNTLGMDGKACVQRLICELAEVPVKDRSLMGEILHRLVEPRRENFNDIENVIDYLEAEDRGRYFGGCFEKYGMCPLTVRRFLPDNYVEMMKKRRRR